MVYFLTYYYNATGCIPPPLRRVQWSLSSFTPEEAGGTVTTEKTAIGLQIRVEVRILFI
jgi:hypothetical protein